MGPKIRISADEITKALNNALRRREQCAGMQATRVFQSDSGPSNWDAEISGPGGETVDPECKRVMLATKLGLQSRFELAID